VRFLRLIRLRARSLLRGGSTDAEMRREIQLHLDQLTKEYVASGMSEGEARLAARRAFGPLDQVKERCRDMRRVNFVEDVIKDLGYALRMLRRSPGFTITAVLSLALGIGVTTAIFTIVNAVILRPLPYPDADRLVMVWQDLRARGERADEWASPGNFVDWRTRLNTLAGVAAIGGWRPALTGAFEAESLVGEQVSYEYLQVLRVRPAVGRDFTEADDLPGARRVTLIGDDLWRRRFGADPAIVGQVIVLAGEPHEVIGVLPAGFRPIVSPAAEIWRPLRLNRANPARGAIVLRIVARVDDGVDLRAAQSEATQLAARLEGEFPSFNEKVGFALEPLHDRVTNDIRPGLLTLAGAVMFVLLIACANIANLLLARASNRDRELAVRAALGAGRARVVRQLLTENLLLAAAGGVAGLLAGIWGIRALVALAPPNSPRLGEIGIDWFVFAVALLLTAVTGLLFGLAPSLQHGRRNVAQALREGGRGSAGPGGHAIRRVLVAAEVALAVVLLTGGALLAQTFVKLQTAELGFRIDDLLVGAVFPPRVTYNSREQLVTLYDRILERTAAIPGVQRAALSSVLPFDGGDSDMNVEIVGQPPPAGLDAPVTWYRLVSAESFEVLGLRFTRGRAFVPREPAPSVVVNEMFAQRYFGGADPLGRQLRFGDRDSPPFTITGVVADTRGRGARGDTRVEVFLPYWQFAEGTMNLVLLGPNPGALAPSLRQAVAAVDPNIPVVGMRTMADALGESVSQPRFLAVLAGAFAVMALGLAMIGIYGVMAYTVAQRTSEMGVRMALGADRHALFRLVVGDGLKLTAAGVGAGMVGALLTGRWLDTLLFGVAPTDPRFLTVTALVLLAVALAASALPAWRATRVDPVRAVANGS
jgi:putative ABC transport system permease protein